PRRRHRAALAGAPAADRRHARPRRAPARDGRRRRGAHPARRPGRRPAARARRRGPRAGRARPRPLAAPRRRAAWGPPVGLPPRLRSTADDADARSPPADTGGGPPPAPADAADEQDAPDLDP